MWLLARCLFFCLASVTTGYAAEEDGSAEFPRNRYDALIRKNPFSLAAPTASEAKTTPSFAENWCVAGIGRVGGVDFVTLSTRDQTMTFSLYGAEIDSRTGVQLEKVEWSDGISRSRIILRKGNETAELSFEKAEVRAPIQELAFFGHIPKIPAGVRVVDPLAPNQESGSQGRSLTSAAPAPHTPLMRLLPR